MNDAILEAVGLTKRFRSREEGKNRFTAVDGASLRLYPGETLGLLGESGSGKSTLGQMLVGLLRPDEGQILYRGAPLAYPYKGEARRRIQILFQHPEVSFNPQLTLRQSLTEPFRLRGLACDDGALAAGFHISSVPTVLILKNGKVADQSVGFKPGPAMKSWIESNL